jgi:hypothetical protein
MGQFEIRVTEEPGPISGLDAKGFGVLLRRDTAPDLRCVVRANGRDFRVKNPRLWDDPRLFRAIVEAELPHLRAIAEVTNIDEADQPWEHYASAPHVKEILEADDADSDTRLYRFVQVDEVLARWDT